MDARKARAEELLATRKIGRRGDLFFVPSQSGGARHSVRTDDGVWSCCCPDFEERQLPCKHIYAAQLLVEYDWAAGEKLLRPAARLAPRPAYSGNHFRHWRLARQKRSSSGVCSTLLPGPEVGHFDFSTLPA
jgi:SWIM zinc finger